MSTWKVILATVVIFVTGVITGTLVVKRIMNRPVPVPANIARAVALKRMTGELGLSSGQREEVEQILRESNERTKLLWEFVGPYFQDEYRTLNAELRAVLNPDQRRKFDRLLKERQQRIKGKPAADAWRPSQPGGGGGGQQGPRANRPTNEPGPRRQGIPAGSQP